MSTQKLNSTEKIRQGFQELFEKNDEEQIEHRAQMLSFLYLSEIEKALDRKKWTRKQLAEEIGTSASYLTQLFRGDRMLNFKTIAKIERALALNFEVFEETNTMDAASQYLDYFLIDNAEFEGISFDPEQGYEPENYKRESSGCKIHELRAA